MAPAGQPQALVRRDGEELVGDHLALISDPVTWFEFASPICRLVATVTQFIFAPAAL